MGWARSSVATVTLRVVAAAAIVICVSRVGGYTTAPSGASVAPVSEDHRRIQLSAEQVASDSFSATGQPQLRSLLNVEDRMRYGEFVWDDEGIPEGPVWVRIDLDTQLISVFRAGHEIGTAVILYGADEKPTPVGGFTIMEKRKDHRSNLYDAPMPYMLRLTSDGIAIHGSDVKWGAATHGCVGVPTAFAAYVFDQVQRGSPVTIVGQNPKPARMS